MPQDEDIEYGYKVDLEEFSGPLDLLLYLIRQEEVDVTNIPIACITEQYLAHLEVIQAINVNLAGDFLVMAATLMEVKSRMLLPRPEHGEEEEEDPRADLIRQLIEYKKFKDAARQLAGQADAQALKFARGAAAALGLPDAPPDDDLPILLGEVTVWDLVAAFKIILRQTTLDTTRHIVLDDRPLMTYCNDLLDTLRERPTTTFRDLFEPGAGRLAIISLFLALLELIRRRRVRAEQGGHRGEIRIVLLDDTPISPSEVTEEPPHPEPQPHAGQPAQAPVLDDEVPTPDSEVDDIVVPEVEPLPDAADQPPEPPAGAAPKRPGPRRPVAPPLVRRSTLDEEFDVDGIEVPEFRTAPPPPPEPQPAQPWSGPLPVPSRRRPAPTLLALLASHRPQTRRARIRGFAPRRPARRRR